MSDPDNNIGETINQKRPNVEIPYDKIMDEINQEYYEEEFSDEIDDELEEVLDSLNETELT